MGPRYRQLAYYEMVKTLQTKGFQSPFWSFASKTKLVEEEDLVIPKFELSEHGKHLCIDMFRSPMYRSLLHMSCTVNIKRHFVIGPARNCIQATSPLLSQGEMNTKNKGVVKFRPVELDAKSQPESLESDEESQSLQSSRDSSSKSVVHEESAKPSKSRAKLEEILDCDRSTYSTSAQLKRNSRSQSLSSKSHGKQIAKTQAVISRDSHQETMSQLMILVKSLESKIVTMQHDVKDGTSVVEQIREEQQRLYDRLIVVTEPLVNTKPSRQPRSRLASKEMKKDQDPPNTEKIDEVVWKQWKVIKE